MPLVEKFDGDTFGRSLIQTPKKPNQGEKLDPKALTKEFNANLRAIQCDLNERFALLQMEKNNGLCHLHSALLGQQRVRDVGKFARLARVSGLLLKGRG